MTCSCRSYLLPLCKWNHFHFYEDYRIFPMTALTFLHLDFRIALMILLLKVGKNLLLL